MEDNGVHAVPLERVISGPFQMVSSAASEGRARRSAPAAASSSSSSSSISTSVPVRLLLPPGVLQAANSIIAEDARAFEPGDR